MILFRIRTLIISTLALVFLVFLFSCKGDINKNKFGKQIHKNDRNITTTWDTTLSPKLEEWFKKLSTTNGFNGNLLVAKSGQIIYQNSSGYANFDKKDTLTLESRFQTGSLSKPFTAMAIMILKERGQLNYKDEVEKYIPGFPYKGVTIWQLLSHRSGLPNYNYFSDEYTDKETTIYNSDVVKMMIDSIPAAYAKPNTHFEYCNTNYVLLSYIVEKVSKMPFENFMEIEIFKKAGMKNTSILINGKQTRIYKAATGYHFKWSVATLTYQDGVTGDKGVYTTIEDLFMWNLALDNNLLVKKETLEEAFQPTSHEKKGNRNYGLGWRMLNTIDSSKLVYHGGWWRGFNSLFLKDIKNDAVIVLLSNVRSRAFYLNFRQLLGIVDPERGQMQAEIDSLYLKQVNGKDSIPAELDL